MPPASAPFRTLIRAATAVLGFAAAASAFVGDWASYSDFSVPTCIISWHGEVFVGTSGGIRRIQSERPFRETQYNNMQGLLDVRIAGFAVDADDRLWAASRSGQLFRLEGKTWSAWGKSYKAAAWTINRRAVAAAGRYLIIGSSQGLSLFDRTTGLAAVNLTKFANLGQQPVTGVLPVGDTLYVATGKAILRAPIDWKNALSTRFGGTVFDPAIWKPATGLAELPAFLGQPTPGDTLVDSPEQDSARLLAAARPVELRLLDGKVAAHDSGAFATAPYPIKALMSSVPVIDGKVFPGLTSCEAILTVGNRVWIGGAQGLFAYNQGEGLSRISSASPIPEAASDQGFARIAAVSARGGSVWFMNGLAAFAFLDGKSVIRHPYGARSREVYLNEMRTLSALPDGDAMLGTWGLGLVRVDATAEPTYWYGANSCLKGAVEGFTVVRTMGDPRGNDLWLTLVDNVVSRETYHMAHLDLATGVMSCPDLEGNSNHTYATRILNDTVFAVASPKGIRLYRFGIGGIKGAIARAGALKGGSGDDFGRDMAMDGNDRLWALMNGKVGYVDNVSLKLGQNANIDIKYLEGFPGKNCGVMEADVRQGLWIGCENGFYNLKPEPQAALSQYDHFDSEDGLLGDLVLDLSMDPETGRLWVVTENGISAYQSEAKPHLSGVGGVKAYPNPFREKHSLLVIDNVPKGATGAIFTQSGNAVRRFASGDARGNQFQWDGNNEAGRRVKPGIYMYSVSGSSGTARGKIIVAR